MRRDPAALAARRFDLLVVGGGIVGGAIARDAARRGLAVALVERALDASRQPLVGWAVTAVVLAVTAVAVARRRQGDGEAVRDTTVLMSIAVLVCIYHLTYDVLLLTLPAVVFALTLANRSAPERERVVALALLVAIAVPALNYFATETAAQALGSARAHWWVAITSTNSLAGIALLGGSLALASMRRQTDRAEPVGRRNTVERPTTPGGGRNTVERPGNPDTAPLARRVRVLP